MEKVRVLVEFKSILQDENACIEEFISQEQEVKSAMMERDWPKLERALGDLETQSGFLSVLEEKRQDLWKEIMDEGKWEQNQSFHEIMAHFPKEWRENLGSLYRQVRMNTLRLKGMTEGIDAYVRATTAVIKEAIGPEAGGKGATYNQKGSLNTAPQRPLILDQSY
jgi:hypothetical protein